MPRVQQCTLSRELAAHTLQKAMVDGRQVRLFLIARPGAYVMPSHDAGGPVGERVGDVSRMMRGRPGADPYAPADEVTFTLVEHPQDGVAIASAPIALSRVRALELLD